MIVLGIESSCDETAAAVVTDDKRILANVVLSQLDEHRPFGGVVPEIAARSHLEVADEVVAEALYRAGVAMSDLDGVAVTGGPGLIGGVMVGVMTAKAIALVHDLPFIAVNHLEGHALTARLTGEVDYPFLLLLVSGGHCQLLIVEKVGQYRRLGTTIDDALGEAFDKTAKLLNLGIPGGPAVEAMARDGDPDRFSLPRPMKGRDGCNFSFSGLKTAVRQTVARLPDGKPTPRDIADLCAGFQAAAADVLADRCVRAITAFKARHPGGNALVVAGGVAANVYLRGRLEDVARKHDMTLSAPPIGLCTDNGAMIAWAGLENLSAGRRDSLDFRPRPRWPLDPDAPSVGFAGVKA